MSLRIFLTTDNHVGFNETDPVRGADASNSFEEAIALAVETNSDFVLQGGDLFHMNKPTNRSMYRVLKTLRKYCLGNSAIEFDVVNHGQLALPDAPEFNHVNFHDPNYNISLPVFTISGNHDDAGGSATSVNSLLSPLDVLAMSGLVNHFGRVHDSDDITITPLLIEKQEIKCAIYGLASVRDERLYRTFRSKKVKFLRPKQDPDSWFSILVVHQNHSQHGPTNFLPEEFLPNFLNLVIWGHEHECLIDPVYNPSKGFSVIQPGSTVITSLSESETHPKHVGVLTIGVNKSFELEKIPLKSARPFAFHTLSLESCGIKPGPESRAKISEFLIDEVEKLIKTACDQYKNVHNTNECPLPLVRLRVDYSGGYEIENSVRFSKRFVGRTANTTDILHCVQKRERNTRLAPKTANAATSGTNGSDSAPEMHFKNVTELVKEILASERMDILEEQAMREALVRFVDKDEKTALKTKVDKLVGDHINQVINSVSEVVLDDHPEVIADQHEEPEEPEVMDYETGNETGNDTKPQPIELDLTAPLTEMHQSQDASLFVPNEVQLFSSDSE